MEFIAIKTKDGESKGDIAFFCRTLHAGRQGFYRYLANKDHPWKYPNRRRKDQEIQLVTDLGPLWESDEPEKDVPINACVVHDKKTDKYFVFMTTDTGRTAQQIINTYELRPEIEEDFRQMKDFWKLEDFKSTKYNYITCHIVMTLAGYLYFQIYKNLDEGKKYSGKSLPVPG